MSVALIYTQDFLTPQNQSYSNYEDYIDYIENNSKTKVKMELDNDYVDYIENDDKVLFNSFNYKKDLSNDEVKAIKESFKMSRENGCNLYRGVYSFDSKFLLDNDIINEDNELINQDLLIESIQKSVSEINKQSRIDYNNLVWIANFHFNTDNIHCHIAYIDQNEYQLDEEERLKMVINSEGINKIKTKVINNIVDHSNEYNLISSLRNEIRNKIKLNSVSSNLISEKSIVRLYQKYGDKLLYLNTQKSQFTKDEIQEIINEVKPIFYEDEELVKLISEYTSTVDKLEEQFKYYYGDNNKQYKENKLEQIDNIMLTALKQSIRDVKKSNPEILILIKNSKKIKNINLLSDYVNHKNNNVLKKILKKNMYKSLQEQKSYNMNVYNEILNR